MPTATEFRELQHLSMAAGQVLTHGQLLHRVWNPNLKGDPWLVRNVVKKIRDKIGDDPEDPACIFSRPSVDYRKPKGDESNEDSS